MIMTHTFTNQVLKITDLDKIGLPERPDFIANPHKYFSDGFTETKAKGTKLPVLFSDIKQCMYRVYCLYCACNL